MKKGNIVAFTSGEKKFYVDEWLVDGENIFMNDGGQADSKYFNGKAYYSDHVFAFTSEKVNVKFLYHYLLKMNTEINEKYFRGGGIKNLVKKEFLEMLIPIPHIDIQKRIVHVLDNFEKICKDLNIGLPAEIELREKQYEYYRDLLLNFPENIVEGGAYSFEEIKLLLFTFETVKVTIGSVLQGLKNETLKKSELIKDGEFPVINSGTSLYGYYDKCNNDGNTITIASRGSNAGHIKYIDEKFWAGGLCYPYRSLNENIVNTKYIYYFLKNKEKHICDELVEKGSIPALNKSTIEQFPITIPSPKIQKRIVHVLDNFEKICEDLNIGLPAEIELRKKQYEYYRDKLLSFK